MGLYLEEVAGSSPTKLGWLEANGEKFTISTKSKFEVAFPFKKDGKEVTLAFLDNGAFQAVAVMFSKAEFARCMNGRPDAVWWLVPREKLPAKIQKELK